MKDNFGKICEDAIRILVEYMPPADKLIKPTLLHCIRVGTYLYNNGYSQDIVLGGYLHDLVEDTEVENDLIEKKFGKKVLDIVLANSEDEKIIENPKQELLDRCVLFGEETIVVKAADILDNYKYYKRINSQEGLDYCSENTNYLLKIVPDDFNDKIFDELRKFHLEIK